MTGLTTESHKKIGQLSKGIANVVDLPMRYPQSRCFNSRRAYDWFRSDQLIEIRNVIKMQVRTYFSLRTSCRK
jgi:hypothetical protein